MYESIYESGWIFYGILGWIFYSSSNVKLNKFLNSALVNLSVTILMSSITIQR